MPRPFTGLSRRPSTRRSRRFDSKAIAFATAVMLAVAAPAFATHNGSAQSDEEDEGAPITISFDDELGILVYSLPPENPEDEPADCELSDGTSYEVDGDGNVTTVNSGGAPGEVADGCVTLVIDSGNDDKISHGDVVSQTVHTLKELDLDGPFGQYVRVIAKSDAGKPDHEDDLGEDAESDASNAQHKADKEDRAAERQADKAAREAERESRKAGNS